MSVSTTLDDRLEDAKRALNELINNLSEVVVNRCHGWEDCIPDRQKELRDLLHEALEMRDKL